MIILIIMLHLFRSKNFRAAYSLLQNLRINNEEFREFQIEHVASNIKSYQTLFTSILEVINEIKLSPFKTLKIALFCLQVLHCSKDNRVYELVFDYLHVLQDRVNSLLRAKKNVRTCGSVDVLGTSNEFIDKSWEVEEMDLSSIILERIVTPLICFQQKVIACQDVIYATSKHGCINEAVTWSCINLIRKIVDIGPDIESLGRYYFKESSSAVICLMKIVNSDIQSLYKKILEYFRRKIATVQVLFEENKMTMGEIVQQYQLNEFMLMIEELEVINERLRVLYNGRYFIAYLVDHYIFLPVLFTQDQNMDLVYKIKQYQAQQGRKNRSLQALNRRKIETDALEVVEYI